MRCEMVHQYTRFHCHLHAHSLARLFSTQLSNCPIEAYASLKPTICSDYLYSAGNLNPAGPLDPSCLPPGVRSRNLYVAASESSAKYDEYV
jgi:hypothetical protein